MGWVAGVHKVGIGMYSTDGGDLVVRTKDIEQS